MDRAKKELGQHWLEDASILEAIADAADLSADDYVLEIGPGKGTLTEVLASRSSQVLALEYDKDLIPQLKILARAKEFTVVEGDVRTFDFGTLPEKYKIVANIPYYLTSHLIRSISETLNPPEIAVLLIQKEVAQRLCAGPGKMSILAVTAQFYFECALDVEVPARYFAPPPKVDSQVVSLKHRPEKLFDVDEQKFFQLVKAGFSGKRKTMRNSLSGGLRVSKEEVESLLKNSGLKPGSRAQELSLDDWHKLFKEYNKA